MRNVLSWPKAAFILAVLLLPGLLLLTTVLYVSFDEAHYLHLWEKHDVAAEAGLAPAELAQAGRETLRYMRGDSSDPIIRVPIQGRRQPLYGEQATHHLVEVRDLYRTVFFWRGAGWAALILILALGVASAPRPRSWLGHTLTTAALLALATAGLLVLAFAIDFHRAWALFHKVFFATDLWLLAPEERMLRMFPAAFFLDTIIRVAILWAAQVMILLLLGLVLLRRPAAAALTTKSDRPDGAPGAAGT